MKRNQLIRIIDLNVTCKVQASDGSTTKTVCIESGRVYWIENINTLGRAEWIATVVSRDASGRTKIKTTIQLFHTWAQGVLKGA